MGPQGDLVGVQIDRVPITSFGQLYANSSGCLFYQPAEISAARQTADHRRRGPFVGTSPGPRGGPNASNADSLLVRFLGAENALSLACMGKGPAEVIRQMPPSGHTMPASGH